MYTYRPAEVAPGSPLVVALHGCTQDAADYFGNSGWRKYADLWGFTLVFPQQSSANNLSRCFNWFQGWDASRGQGEALSIKQMVDHALANDGSDSSRVYVTGLSAGGAMTAVMGWLRPAGRQRRCDVVGSILRNEAGILGAAWCRVRCAACQCWVRWPGWTWTCH
jgi:poly(hydroxyalkanoate) depolymerase family esterase